jgi:hypothetical protein
MRFTLYENGVTNDLVMDYGKYALSGSLEHLEPIDAADCPSAAPSTARPLGDEGQPQR